MVVGVGVAGVDDGVAGVGVAVAATLVVVDDEVAEPTCDVM